MKKQESMEEKEEQMESPAKKEVLMVDLPGVGAATAEKLRESGYATIISIAVATPGELIDAAGLTELTARKMIKAARDAMAMGFESGEDLLRRRQRVVKLSFGVRAMNELLGGGLESGAITEAYGAYGSAKTQIAHQLAVMAQLPTDQGGAEGSVIYIDTENTFRPERISQIAQRFGMDPMKALENIKVARAYNSDHQMLLAEKVEDLITQGLNVKLVVVDSLTAHFRAEFVGRGTLADRQQKLNRHMHTLAKIADIYNVAVYVTNQVMAKPDMFFGDPTEGVGGHIVGHNSTFRLYFRRGKKGTRVAKLVDSPNLPDGECVFNITQAGVEDI